MFSWPTQESLGKTHQNFLSDIPLDFKLFYLNLEEKDNLRNWRTWGRWVPTVVHVSFPSDSSYMPDGRQAHGKHMWRHEVYCTSNQVLGTEHNTVSPMYLMMLLLKKM